jgi:hypothetical protein
MRTSDERANYALCFLYALPQVVHELAEQPAQPLEPATALVAPLPLLVRAAKVEISRRTSLPWQVGQMVGSSARAAGRNNSKRVWQRRQQYSYRGMENSSQT